MMGSQKKSSSQYNLLLPLNHFDGDTLDELPTDRKLFDVSFGKFAVATVSLPLIGFITCVVWSLMFNFVQTTATHCNVANFLPSMSAAIGSHSPQKYIWRITIALHTTPRYLVSYMYYAKHKSKFVLTLNWLEISGLAGLTFVSSTENYPFHAKCFVTFMSTALVYMFLVSYSSHFRINRVTQVAKRYLAWINLTAGFLAVYFFMRHNSHCEPGVYTLFALSEYVIVSSNIFFHFQAYYDFQNVRIYVQNGRIDKSFHSTQTA